MPARKFLFVSYDGLIADIAWQVVKEGQDVRFWIKDPDEQEIADGFVPKSRDWKQDVAWADVVVFDDVLGMGAMAAGGARGGQARGRRVALHRPPGGRPRVRPGRS